MRRMTVVSLATLLTVLAPAAARSATPAAGQTSCRASLVRVSDIGLPPGSGPVEPLVANPPGDPCLWDGRDAPGKQGFILPIGLGKPVVLVYVLSGGGVATESYTDLSGPSSFAQVQPTRFFIYVGGVGGVIADIAYSYAGVSCPGPAPAGHSSVTDLAFGTGLGPLGNVPTQRLNASGPVDIDLGQLGTLHLNQTVLTADSVTQRALVWDNPLFEVVVGEAEARVAAGACL